MKVIGAYHGLDERQDYGGRTFYTFSIEGFRIEVPGAISSALVPRLRELPLGTEIAAIVAPAWRGRDKRWLSWVLLSLDGRG